MIKVAILTVSDSCAHGKREDVSGQTIREILPKEKFEINEMKITSDDQKSIADELRHYSDKIADIDIVLTTGGTGLGPRDVTPEATASVCERTVPGLGEILRTEGFKRSSYAILSRSMAGIRNSTLIVNLPGSPRAVRECLEIILVILPHAVEMMRGGGH